MGNGHRLKLREKLRRKQGNRCCYCLMPLTLPANTAKTAKALPTTETLEHLRRKIDGGSNCRDNMALACHRCNSDRGHMDWLTYTSYRRGEIDF